MITTEMPDNRVIYDIASRHRVSILIVTEFISVDVGTDLHETMTLTVPMLAMSFALKQVRAARQHRKAVLGSASPDRA